MPGFFVTIFPASYQLWEYSSMPRSSTLASIAMVSMLIGMSASMPTNAECLPNPAYREDEAKALRKAKGRALRDGWVLRIMTDLGPIDFADTDCEDGPADECVKYALVGVLPERDLWVVHVGYYEDGAYELVNMRTGVRTSIDAFPQFSPDGQSFVTAVYSSHSDYSRLAIWTLRPDGPSEEWNYDYSADAPTGEWWYCVERWEGSKRVVLKGEGLFDDPKRYSVRKVGRAWIDFDGASWRYRHPTKLQRLQE